MANPTRSTSRNPSDVFKSLYVSLGNRLSKNLFDEVAQAKSLRPTLTISKGLAIVLATLVHALTLIFGILGIALIVRGWPNFLIAFFGLLCILIAWLLRPRFAKLKDELAPRDTFPTLYRIADNIAQALGTTPVAGLVVDWRFNASFTQVSWRRKKIIYLGLPLLMVLEAQERVALIAHELAHGINGDLNRGFFVGNAIQSLVTWHYLLRPTELWPSGSGIYGLAVLPFNTAALILSFIPYWSAYALSYLLYRDSQRAEYLADYLAATVSGSEATISAFWKLHLERTFYYTVRVVSLNRRDESLFDEFRHQIAAQSADDLARIRAEEFTKPSRLDITHPPTAYRVEFLKAHGVVQPKFELSSTDYKQIDRELATVQKKISERLMDSHRRSLYY